MILSIIAQGVLLLQAVVLASSASANVAQQRAILGLESESSPNPIASQYPNDVTGTINGTFAVVPIHLKLARSIIPAQYKILTKAYKSLLPNFPADKYPLFVQAILDHDIQYQGVNALEDFQSIHVTYPFVDLLGDGYSSFAYASHLLVTDTNLVAIGGSQMYGTPTTPATFKPKDEAYGWKSACTSETTFMDAYTVGVEPVVKTSFEARASIKPWPFQFYVNITNQPIFTDGLLGCDNQIHLFNTTLSDGKTGIRGNISIAAPYLPSSSEFKNVYGLRTDLAFIEHNLVPCQSMKGYSGTGPGDRI